MIDPAVASKVKFQTEHISDHQPHSGPHTHLGDCYFRALVDKLDDIVGLSLVRSYEEALGECEDLSRILLAHEAGRVMLLSPGVGEGRCGDAVRRPLTHGELRRRQMCQTPVPGFLPFILSAAGKRTGNTWNGVKTSQQANRKTRERVERTDTTSVQPIYNPCGTNRTEIICNDETQRGVKFGQCSTAKRNLYRERDVEKNARTWS
ncbi:Hypothetical protein SMAX5B_019419 [Scophthalmus maximus]|uniref:Uncharacterized protein n=1 Tax=Scophthalmus maximus TaxID=52904 RepID=A0A2U9CYS6_SCOMX|nr:Hypothetical protein SMAX5B_019419 [Scophthalmus maximus]